MVENKRVICILPAYNAAKTLERTLSDVPKGIVDLFIVTDDCSKDDTFEVATKLSERFPIKVLRHEKNRGYGGNQKTCYSTALQEGADIVVMLHPDYQYEPKLLGCMVNMIASGVFDVALGSRILGKGALTGGMPVYKYFANRFLTAFENIMLGLKLSEYHTGYRAYSREVLARIPFELNSDDFVFDNEFLVQCRLGDFRIGEISIPTKYFEEASSISFRRSCIYGMGVLRCSIEGFLARMGLVSQRRYLLQSAQGTQKCED
ncbi:MAG: hypothetical protein RL189_1176 [Pseudomonadota bacterium]|jgi:glycosyltransferase involved in cell wall biosynthesis